MSVSNKLSKLNELNKEAKGRLNELINSEEFIAVVDIHEKHRTSFIFVGFCMPLLTHFFTLEGFGEKSGHIHIGFRGNSLRDLDTTEEINYFIEALWPLIRAKADKLIDKKLKKSGGN